MSAPANRGAAAENKEETHLTFFRFRVLLPFNGNTRERKNRAKKGVLTGVTCVPMSRSHVTEEGHM